MSLIIRALCLITIAWVAWIFIKDMIDRQMGKRLKNGPSLEAAINPDYANLIDLCVFSSREHSLGFRYRIKGTEGWRYRLTDAEGLHLYELKDNDAVYATGAKWGGVCAYDLIMLLTDATIAKQEEVREIFNINPNEILYLPAYDFSNR